VNEQTIVIVAASVVAVAIAILAVMQRFGIIAPPTTKAEQQERAKRKAESDPPPKRSEQMGPGLSDSQRMEIPFISRDECETREGAVSRRFDSLERKVDKVAAGIARIEGWIAGRTGGKAGGGL
jgi:hypothetical protein